MINFVSTQMPSTNIDAIFNCQESNSSSKRTIPIEL